MSRGRYIGLEGVEGSGKSTVAGLLAEALTLEGLEVVVVREPGGTELGEALRHLLLHSGQVDPWAEAAMFAAARAQLARQVVAPALDAGTWVISDRTYYSSIAYQGAGRGLDADLVRSINELVLGETLPDVVFVLDVDPAVGFARETEPDRISEAGLNMQRVVADAYRRLGATDDRVRVVDAGDAPALVADVIRRSISEVLDAV